MSTRCVINFSYGTSVHAKVYRHSDGYPDTKHGVLADLEKFFTAVKKQTNDTRFGDPTYLSAKYVVWQADQNAKKYTMGAKGMTYKKAQKLDFLSVGICIENPGDIEYEYNVNCEATGANGNPVVTYREARR